MTFSSLLALTEPINVFMTYAHSSAPIGIFDSGFGGLSVMKAIVELLPHENIIYFGDCARVPYGNKSKETICSYSMQNSQFLLAKGVKVILIACNTASAYAPPHLRNFFPHMPVVDVIEPTVHMIARDLSITSLALLATKATVRSDTYATYLHRLRKDLAITSIAAPLLVPLIEEDRHDRAYSSSILDEYLAPLHEKPHDALLLACTHYPLIKKAITAKLPPSIKIIDCAHPTSLYLKGVLEDAHLLNKSQEKPYYDFYTSDDAQTFASLGSRFLGCPIDHVQTSILQNH